ncbi:MAG: ABC transporter ATP-binding protein [Synergistaceae bacterium]|jgi:taurine transport system ATP-binding protein|nr:ABC transporter ATP-binding protein [Synergistaceae bacterium]
MSRDSSKTDSIDSMAGVMPDARRIVIHIEGLSVSYRSDFGDTVRVLDNIDLDIGDGDFTCLLGSSGCGKSTLLKVIAGLLEPTCGSVTMDGKRIAGADWHRGVVFQNPPLYPWLSVEENVAFGPKMRGVPKCRIGGEVLAYLDKVHLAGSAKKKIYELSGGMRQRVAIARSLINDPRILLMDEPFGALDALTREQMQTLVRSLWTDTRKTILFITHDVDEALMLGTRVLVMSNGTGKIEHDISVDFTRRASGYAGETGENIRISREYQKIRGKILSAIHGDQKYAGI